MKSSTVYFDGASASVELRTKVRAESRSYLLQLEIRNIYGQPKHDPRTCCKAAVTLPLRLDRSVEQNKGVYESNSGVADTKVLQRTGV